MQRNRPRGFTNHASAALPAPAPSSTRPPRNGAAPMENAAARRCEQRKAVYEVRRAVDRNDGPDKVGISARTFGQLLADDAVIGKVFGQSSADWHFDPPVDLRHRIVQADRIPRASFYSAAQRSFRTRQRSRVQPASQVLKPTTSIARRSSRASTAPKLTDFIRRPGHCS